MLGEVFEILVARRLFGKLKVEIAYRGFEGYVAHHGAQHVKEHGAFVHHDGTIVGRVGRKAARLRHGRGVFVHQRADGELIDGA